MIMFTCLMYFVSSVYLLLAWFQSGRLIRLKIDKESYSVPYSTAKMNPP